MDASRLRIVDGERLIPAVPVDMIAEFAVQFQDIIHQAERELLGIAPVALALQELPPGLEEILNADDLRVAAITLCPHIALPHTHTHTGERFTDYPAVDRRIQALGRVPQ